MRQCDLDVDRVGNSFVPPIVTVADTEWPATPLKVATAEGFSVLVTTWREFAISDRLLFLIVEQVLTFGKTCSSSDQSKAKIWKLQQLSLVLQRWTPRRSQRNTSQCTYKWVNHLEATEDHSKVICFTLMLKKMCQLVNSWNYLNIGTK